MLRKGFELSDQEISEEYKKIGNTLSMPWYFYRKVSALKGVFSGNRILDIGCGNGFLLRELAKNSNQASKRGEFSSDSGNTRELFALDNTFELVKNAKARSNGIINAIQASASNAIPFKDKSFDMAVSTEVLEHLKKPELYLNEIKRILKPGGKAVITTPNGTAFMPFMKIAEKLPQKYGVVRVFMHPEHPLITPQPIAAVYSFSELCNLFESNGFRIAKVTGFECFPYFFDLLRLVFGKTFIRPLVDLTWRVQFVFDRLVALVSPRLYYRLVFVIEPKK